MTESTSSPMPVLFVGHGSPMNAIEQNEFSAAWAHIAQKIPTPRAILCLSAHWLTHGLHVTAMPHPKTIHDFYGFPEVLYQVQYPASGDADLARRVGDLLREHVRPDTEWGLDHGAWSVLRLMYSQANIPVVQLSLDIRKPAQYYFDMGKVLSPLREEGILILASGNVVHNLGKINFYYPAGFDWAMDIHELIKKKIVSDDLESLINYSSLGPDARLAIPSADHYYPLLPILGAKRKNEPAHLFNDKVVLGSISMLSVAFGLPN